MKRIKSKYAASLTREQFLYYEMRTTAKLFLDNLTDDEIYEKIKNENLYQLPSEKSIRMIFNGCIKRIHILDNKDIINIIAYGNADDAKQACLYAFMKHYLIVFEFMVFVIGEKYRMKDYHFDKSELNSFITQLQEQDEGMASWSDATIKKIKQVLMKLLVDTGYLDNRNSNQLNQVMLCYLLEEILVNYEDDKVLSAFNYFR